MTKRKIVFFNKNLSWLKKKKMTLTYHPREEYATPHDEHLGKRNQTQVRSSLWTQLPATGSTGDKNIKSRL